MNSEVGPYYRARYYDPTAGRFLSEDPSRFYGGRDFYAYVTNNPVGFADPMGLFTVRNNIQVQYTPNVDKFCANSAGACTRAQAILLVACDGCSETGYRAKATLGIYGDMYVFSGTWPYMGRAPKDTSVTDANSAIDHEYNVHINPAVQSVTPMIEKLESKTFKTKEDCEKQAKKTAKAVHNGFSLDLAETQREENMR